jgi:hypothetical protein
VVVSDQAALVIAIECVAIVIATTNACVFFCLFGLPWLKSWLSPRWRVFKQAVSFRLHPERYLPQFELALKGWSPRKLNAEYINLELAHLKECGRDDLVDRVLALNIPGVGSPSRE